ncbi:beta-ketoacyl synthase [Delphinella strobiligena]|nr:beta-ketoacyl synthase [Delphinella strobiligena]
MPGQQRLYLFGDQTFDVLPHLNEFSRYRANPIFEDFLSKSYDAIRREIYKLPQQVRDNLPRMTAIDDLIFWKQGEERCIPLDMALTCLYQLGMFIIGQTGLEYPRTDNARVLGLCTGALSAAAVSCSRSTFELVPLAVEVVVVAFNTGIHVTDIANRVELPRNGQKDKCWSMIVVGAGAVDAVAKFCEQSNQPATNQPYISAYSLGGITVSGPPATLARLCSSKPFKDLRVKSIPIYGPYHSVHLSATEDVKRIVACLKAEFAARSNQIPLLSGNGSMTNDGNFETFLQGAVEQILLQPIRWPGIIESLHSWLSKTTAEGFQVETVGTTADQVIYTALKQTLLTSLLPSTPAPCKSHAPSEFASENPKKPKLAIIGSSGRYPGATNNEAYWDVLYRGLDMHKEAPALHWDVKTHVDPTAKAKNTSATPFGCWLDDPAAFDARFFSISPREAAQIDPAQRIALMTAYEAIEQAGLVPDATPSTRRDRVGVFYGVTSNDWMETNSAQDIDTYFIPGGNRAFVPGRINYCFKFSGPSYAVDTACSSSLAGIHLACNALWRGDIDTAIAGGTNVLTNPDFTAGLDRGHFLSRTGNCKTFDDGADGYCRGEGVATIIIKRLEDAIADNDPIQGVILGAYTNHSAESDSITRPHVGAQSAIFNKVLNQAAVSPHDVTYVEMHGTGTQAGDAGEMSSVLGAFAPSLNQVKSGRSDAQAVYLGSAKANIGHGEAVSGVCSVVKVLLMMQKNLIVPHCGIKTRINHKFPTDLEERNVRIALEPTPWMRQGDKPRRVFVNNFSAAGGNSALLIEDAPPDSDVFHEPDPRNCHLVAVSAKSGFSLQANLQSMLTFLKEHLSVPLHQLSYTTTARRQHHLHRAILSGTCTKDLVAQVETAIQQQVGMTRPKKAPRLLFTFTGNGAQYPGMGKQLYDHFSLFRAEMRRLDIIGQSLGFPSMLPVIQSEEVDIGLFEPTPVQLANTCLQIALCRLWASWGISPAAVVGHSLGEYAALNISGVLSDTDTIYLVGKRAQLLEKKCTRDTHSMLVVKGSVSTIESALEGEQFEISCINSEVETVLAGPNADISRYQQALSKAGIHTVLLKVPFAFHSAQVNPILDEFKKIAKGVAYYSATIPILCPLDGTVLVEMFAFNAAYFSRHCREPVNMLAALTNGKHNGAIEDQMIALEIGPHPAVSGMIKAALPQITSLASLQRGRSVWQTLTTALKVLYNAGADIRWSEYHHDFSSAQKVVQGLPHYQWDLKQYWIQYVNDWSLRKGNPPLVITDRSFKLESTTIHRIVEESVNFQKGHMVVEADIARKDLSPLVQGHEVDGIPLCTPSVYCDMALSLGKYLVETYRPHQDQKLIDVTDMTISKALILNGQGNPQPLQAHAEVDWKANAVAIKFMSFDSKQKLQEHSRCVVRFTDRRLLAELQKDADNIKQKAQALRTGICNATAARFSRPMVYRMIRPLARFHDDYRAIDEVILNSETLEASSKLSFGSVKQDGSYHTHPAMIDALTQSCGFTMNCNDNTDLDKEAFMNHGWGGFQIFEPLDFKKSYTTYTQMLAGHDSLWYGDVVVFDDEVIVASFRQIAIQAVPRRVLKAILSMESGKKPQPAPVPSVQPTAKKQISEKASAPPATTRAAPTQCTPAARALVIIAEESGIAQSELTENTNFADVGIDSLLGLTITARFQEELGLEVEFNSLFFEYPTVKDLENFLRDSQSSSGSDTPASSEGDSDSTCSSDTSATTLDASNGVDFNKVLEIVAEESGVAVKDLTDDTSFADAGIDSLLSMVVVSRLRDELELDIQHESLFLECPMVADLRKLLCGDTEKCGMLEEPATSIGAAVESTAVPVTAAPMASAEETSLLLTRKQAVDRYITKYTAGFTVPAPDPSAPAPKRDEKVVLVTGASGSLGSHLVYHLAQLEDVATIVCLNRENKAEPYTRQQAAMRAKGIRFPDALKHKLRVFQSDTSKPMLGLERSIYDGLVSSVTHLIHNAWPMSAKRPLPGFEIQFQVFRNLIDLACEVSARRPANFKFGFQMVSSIGVVGRYDIDGNKRLTVPEQRVGIECLLTNGYAEAKWGCERMLDETLHKSPERFRTMAVRLGQIAGSKTSGYWNPMEHFGFLVKSSQTLGVLPDLKGGLFWTPVNDIAAALSELVLADNTPYPIYHIENPVGQSWEEMNRILAECLHIPTSDIVPFDDWLERVRKAPQKDNPASTLLEFLDDNFLRMSCGGLVLDTKHSVEHSKSLAAVGPVPEKVLRKYIHIWREIGFLKSTAEDRARFDEMRACLWGPT